MADFLDTAYIEVSSGALRHNVTAFRNVIGPNQQIAAVVKANAYGHGLCQVVTVLEPVVDAFQVDDVTELLELRQYTQKRALVLGYIPPAALVPCLNAGAEIAVPSLEQLRVIIALQRTVKIHLKIDALLGRLGLLPTEVTTALELLTVNPQITLSGVYAHFANLEDTESHEHADAQLALYSSIVTKMREQGFTTFEEHISSTAGILTFEGQTSSRHLVRLGIGTYGLYPSRHTTASHASLKLRPALRWVTSLAQVKILPAGHPVGYGLTHITPHETKVAIIPQGYSDGYPRALSSTGTVLVAGKRCPVLGRVAMNMLAIDVSAIPEAKERDEAVLLGTQGDDCITAEELALAAETISYEIIARLPERLERRLVT